MIEFIKSDITNHKSQIEMWFELSIIATILLVGQILFGHFEEKTPRWRILLKNALGITILLLVSYFCGPIWFWVGLLVFSLPALIIHLWWLPKNGVNGWTGEPKDKYYELRGWKKD